MKLIFLRKVPERGNAVSFFFKPPESFTWQAGQHLHYKLPHDNPDKKGIERWFTISSAPFTREIQITTRLTDSSFKRALNNLKEGDTIEADGPHGDFVWITDERPKIWIAGGIGITPFHSMLMQRDNDDLPLDVTVIYANRNTEITYETQLEDLALWHDEFKLRCLIGEKLTAENVEELAPELKNSLVYISGPEEMVKALAGELKERLDLLDEQIKLDEFPHYTATTY
ncbi:MAG: FAD-dependent oxidoreductase [Candidatus Saccharimonadales bacterium]